jgi:hypothetical protein
VSSAIAGEIRPACLAPVDVCTIFISGAPTMAETVYGPMLDVEQMSSIITVGLDGTEG